MNGQEFIDLAGSLVANTAVGSQPARSRTAISRAYYGAFHRAVELLAELDVEVPQNHQGHEEAYRKLFQSGIADAREAARLLHDLRGERIAADYKLAKRHSDKLENAKHCVESAADFFSLATQFLTEPNRTLLKSALSPQ